MSILRSRDRFWRLFEDILIDVHVLLLSIEFNSFVASMDNNRKLVRWVHRRIYRIPPLQDDHGDVEQPTKPFSPCGAPLSLKVRIDLEHGYISLKDFCPGNE